MWTDSINVHKWMECSIFCTPASICLPFFCALLQNLSNLGQQLSFHCYKTNIHSGDVKCYLWWSIQTWMLHLFRCFMNAWREGVRWCINLQTFNIMAEKASKLNAVFIHCLVIKDREIQVLAKHLHFIASKCSTVITPASNFLSSCPHHCFRASCLEQKEPTSLSLTP